jgi:hypothetical protein
MNYVRIRKQKFHTVRRLKYCATNPKDTGSIPDGVIGIFH